MPILQKDLGAWNTVPRIIGVDLGQRDHTSRIFASDKTMVSDKCPNCGASINPYQYKCEYCGNWIYIEW